MTPKELQHKPLLPLAAIMALSLMLATSILLIQPAMAQAKHGVTIHDLAFDPQCLCIEKGDTINWTNSDPLIHTLWFVFAENGSTYLLSDPIPPSESWSYTFTELQKFKLLYYSFKHLWITGTIRVYKVLGDVDGDGDVDPFDFAIFRLAYGSTTGDLNWNEWCDLDGDGDVDPFDFAIFRVNYGKIDP